MMLYPVTVVAGRKGAVPIHILMAEEALGHRLPKGAEVHHIDEDKENWRNDNLVILQNRHEHAELHRKLRVKRAGGDPWTQRLCNLCRTPKDFSAFYPGGGNNSRCRECKSKWARNYNLQRKGLN